MTEKDLRLIKQNYLFKGMDNKELDFALEFYSARERSYAAGDTLQQSGVPMPAFGIVLNGIVQVYMDDAEGNQIIMATNTPGDSFGESLSFLDVPDVPVYIKAIEDSRVLWLKFDKIKTPIPGKCNHQYMCRVMSGFASRALYMNDRIQILSKRTMRQKLMTLLTQYQRKSGSNNFDIPLSREDLAIFLGCDRSALSRELSNMKREGLIDFYRNTFRILK